MAVRFSDLNLRPSSDALRFYAEFLETASYLGYTLLAINFPENISTDVLAEWRHEAEKRGITLIKRATLHPNGPQELLQQLRKVRRQYEVIGVDCLSKAVARQAAKDRRVDVLPLNFKSSRRWLDEAEMELASQSGVCVELSVTEIVFTPSDELPSVFIEARRSLRLIRKFKIPVVASSGSRYPHEMRAPRDVAALLRLLGLDHRNSEDSVSTTPRFIVSRNMEKLNPNFLGVGVRLVDG